MFKKIKNKIAKVTSNPNDPQLAKEAKDYKVRLVVIGLVLLGVGVICAIPCVILAVSNGLKWIDVLENQEYLKQFMRGVFLLIPFVFMIIIGAMILKLALDIKIKKETK